MRVEGYQSARGVARRVLVESRVLHARRVEEAREAAAARRRVGRRSGRSCAAAPFISRVPHGAGTEDAVARSRAPGRRGIPGRASHTRRRVRNVLKEPRRARNLGISPGRFGNLRRALDHGGGHKEALDRTQGAASDVHPLLPVHPRRQSAVHSGPRCKSKLLWHKPFSEPPKRRSCLVSTLQVSRLYHNPHSTNKTCIECRRDTHSSAFLIPCAVTMRVLELGPW